MRQPPIEGIAVDFYRTLTGKERREPTGALVREVLDTVFGVRISVEFEIDFDQPKPIYYADPVANTIPDLITAVAVRHGVPLPDMDCLIDEIWRRVGDHPLDDRAVEAVRELRRRGMESVLYSNMVRPSERRAGTLEEAGLGFMALACFPESGYGKPDPRVYQFACQVAGVPPERMLFVGDDPEKDIVGPMKAGMRAAWINAEAEPGSTPAMAVNGVLILSHLSELPDVLTAQGHIADLEGRPRLGKGRSSRSPTPPTGRG